MSLQKKAQIYKEEISQEAFLFQMYAKLRHTFRWELTYKPCYIFDVAKVTDYSRQLQCQIIAQHANDFIKSSKVIIRIPLYLKVQCYLNKSVCTKKINGYQRVRL